MPASYLKTTSEKGFTLLEVIIAITIGSVLILVCTISLRMGLSHLDRGEAWLNNALKETTVFDFFWQQVSSARSITLPTPAFLIEKDTEPKDDNNEKAKIEKVYFRGETDFMSFITPLSLKMHYGYGLIIATYSLRSDYNGVTLVYTEKKLNHEFLSSAAEGYFEVDTDMDEIVIYEECDDITFEYLKVGSNLDYFGNENSRDIDVGGGYQEWVGHLENQLPKAIKITIKKEDQERELLAPIMVMSSL